MVSLWFPYGIPIVSLWDRYGIPMGRSLTPYFFFHKGRTKNFYSYSNKKEGTPLLLIKIIIKIRRRREGPMDKIGK